MRNALLHERRDAQWRVAGVGLPVKYMRSKCSTNLKLRLHGVGVGGLCALGWAPPSVMVVKSFAGVLIGAIFAVVVARVPAPAAGVAASAQPRAIAAASRCNSRYISDYQNQIRAYDAHPPRNNPADLNARLGDIAELLQAINEEHGVLDSVCPNDTDKAPLFAQLNATVAWALALESDIAAKLNASCPPAAKALPAAMLAQAWLALAAAVNDNNGVVPKAIVAVIPKVQTRAAAVGLTLPAYADTSPYWRDQVADQAKQAVAICPTPVPPPATATPSPYPSP